MPREKGKPVRRTNPGAARFSDGFDLQNSLPHNPGMQKAALYLRSSKDRSDVSVGAQRRELEALANQRGLAIVREFSDTVESAKDEDRPGFQALLLEIKNPSRNWDCLLITDTSRLSRRQYMAYAFDHECSRRGITVIYSKLPEADPITDMVIKGVFRVFDELHSLMSRQKGLAGMRENVHQGWRAGGRAPRGYRLEHHETGAIREGQPVRKSRLVTTAEAGAVRRYLKARAMGIPRGKLLDGMPFRPSSLVDLEWNALTYAGHTVWNMRYPKSQGRKRRPREEWEVKRDTHEALITDAEAEAILSRLESHSSKGRRQGKYMLSGILQTPDGKPWHGSNQRGVRYYKTKGRQLRAETLEQAILNQVKTDILHDRFIDQLTTAVRERYRHQHDTSDLESRVQAISSDIDKLLDLSLKTENPAPMLRKIDELEEQRDRINAEMQELIAENLAARDAARITRSQVEKIIRWNQPEIEDTLPSLVERIILNPQTTSCEVVYSVKMASPRGFEPLLPP